MGFSCQDHSEEKESEFQLIDETSETQQGSIIMEMHHHHHNHVGVEKNTDFWPVEHPMEPPDEDRPVKCPMPESSLINDGGMHENRYAESLRKRVEASGAMEDKERTATTGTEPPARGVRKRHHTLTNGGDLVMTPLMRMPSLPPIPAKNMTIFKMLQELDKFES
ncbi:PREDICTED: uncharacterized protein LOC109361686 [Lupinus angustifolius]|nr:PREDICTED: uncharacterized protein LOC109361685 [Lupinus angustifolius]XP_019462751.1 PREDICTED: uncharacterized protein LOC109361686 [Lupinus angustifolius]